MRLKRAKISLTIPFFDEKFPFSEENTLSIRETPALIFLPKLFREGMKLRSWGRGAGIKVTLSRGMQPENCVNF